MTTLVKLITILSMLIPYSHSQSQRNYLIYSVAQDLPMGLENQKIEKNFYVNLGLNQGVQNNTILDVFRVISISNPYDNKRRVNYKVKIGKLKVIHVSDEASITKFHESNILEKPVLELSHFIVGDHVAVSVN